MTRKELQEQIIFLVSELKKLREGYSKLSDEAFNDKINKNKFYKMWRKADERADDMVVYLQQFMTLFTQKLKMTLITTM